MSKESILKQFNLFSLGGEGIGGWLTGETDAKVFDRLATLDEEPLSKSQFNQLLAFGHQAPVSDGFFSYYWLEAPSRHPYPVDEIQDFEPNWLLEGMHIRSLSHLKWGLYRLFVDALLYFGSVRTAFRELRTLTGEELSAFFERKRFDTEAIRGRGGVLPLQSIPQDDRYLVSEEACKSFGDEPGTDGEMYQILKQAYQNYHKVQGGRRPITFRQLLTGELPNDYADRQAGFELSMDDVIEETISSEEDFDNKYGRVAAKFFAARKVALENTKHYLSIVSELDVYVATSMRNRQDFREMARFCDEVFNDESVARLGLRYFDPTLSAAFGHEDKGLIECLMVKCAKVLVYCAGSRDSYGKDAEAAMALSLGKPVVFYCDQDQRSRFYREVHPLSRLIEFNTGVAVGAMVTDNREMVKTLISRLFENKMQYSLEQHPSRPGYLRLKEQLTDSVVRLQTNDRMLTETFWNHYNTPSVSDSLQSLH